MSLAFLSPRGGAALARSPMERRATAAGAVFEVRDGWRVAVSYGASVAERTRASRTVGFLDRARLRVLELTGEPGTPGTGGERLTASVRRFGTATRAADGAWWCPVTPARTLVLGGSDPAPEHAVDLTCAHVGIELAGPLAGDCLARFCALDVRPAVMPLGGFRPGSVARTPGYVLRTRPDRLLVLVGWAYGEYLWETVATAAERLGGGPIGEDALDA